MDLHLCRFHFCPVFVSGITARPFAQYMARAHNEEICFGLEPAERAALAGLLQRIAVRHELTPGIHPGSKDLRAGPKVSCINL
jgi:hypothetical protein